VAVPRVPVGSSCHDQLTRPELLREVEQLPAWRERVSRRLFCVRKPRVATGFGASSQSKRVARRQSRSGGGYTLEDRALSYEGAECDTLLH
jgi:hypothetical protein